MRLLTVILLFFFLLPNVIGQRKVSIYVNNKDLGHFCYLLWTSDTAKCNPKDTTGKLFFDKNNVVYIHISMVKNGDSVRIFNSMGQNISKRMLNIGRSDGYLYFYYPTDNELKRHSRRDTHYSNKFIQIGEHLKDFKKMGYTLEPLR